MERPSLASSAWWIGEEGGRASLDELGVPLLAVFTGPELLAAAKEAAVGAAADPSRT